MTICHWTQTNVITHYLPSLDQSLMRLKCPKLKLKTGKKVTKFSFEKNFELVLWIISYLILLLLQPPEPGLGHAIQQILVPHNAAVIQGRLVTDVCRAGIAWKAIMESSVQNFLFSKSTLTWGGSGGQCTVVGRGSLTKIKNTNPGSTKIKFNSRKCPWF